MTDEQVHELSRTVQVGAGELARELVRLHMVLKAIATMRLYGAGTFSPDYLAGANAGREYCAQVARNALSGDPNVWPFPSETQPTELPTGEV